MRISIFTSTLTLLLVNCIAIAKLAPALHEFEQQAGLPAGIVAGAGVGIGGLVEPNPTNTLYARLQEQEQALQQKEQELQAKEAYLNRLLAPTPQNLAVLYVLIAALFVLVMLNFGFDLRRYYKNQATAPTS